MPQFLKILWIRINYKLLALHWWDSNLQPVKKVLLKIGALICLVTLPTLWIRYSKKKFGCCNALGSSGGLLLETDICAIEHTYCSFKNAAYTMLVFLYHSLRCFFFLGGGGGNVIIGKICHILPQNRFTLWDNYTRRGLVTTLWFVSNKHSTIMVHR